MRAVIPLPIPAPPMLDLAPGYDHGGRPVARLAGARRGGRTDRQAIGHRAARLQWDQGQAPGEEQPRDAVCLETGETAYMELSGTSSSATSVAFLEQLRANHAGALVVIWDNGPAHGGEAVRGYLATPDLAMRVVRLPAYSPDCIPDEAIWAWAREEVTANACLGTKAQVQEKLAQFFAGLPSRAAEVQSRCRRKLQALAEALPAPTPVSPDAMLHVDPVGASV